MKYVIGLDASTSVVGYTIMDEVENVVEVGYIDLRKKFNDVEDNKLFIIVDYVLKEFYEITSKYDISVVAIESPLGMATGKNINSAILLNRYNYMLTYTLHREGFYIKYIDSKRARKLFLGNKYKEFNKVSKKNDAKKEYIVEKVKPYISHMVEFVKRPRATDRHLEHFYDICDSFVIAKAFFLD